MHRLLPSPCYERHATGHVVTLKVTRFMDVTLPVTLRYPSAQSATFTSSNQLLSLVTLRDAMSQSPQSQQSPSTSLDKSVQTRYVTPCHAVSHVASHSLHSHLPVVKSRYVKPRNTVSVYAPSFLVVTPSSRCPSSLSHTPVTLSRLLVLLSHLLVSLSHPRHVVPLPRHTPVSRHASLSRCRLPVTWSRLLVSLSHLLATLSHLRTPSSRALMGLYKEMGRTVDRIQSDGKVNGSSLSPEIRVCHRVEVV